MKVLLIGGLMLLASCAMHQTTPFEARTQKLIKCTKEFMAYNERVKDASAACMAIYAKPKDESRSTASK